MLGSESVAVSEDGDLYMLDKFGAVFRSKDKRSLERLAFLGAGRPLGFHFDKAGNLLICNAGSGLQMLEKESGKLVLLATEAPSEIGGGQVTPIRYANDLAIAGDGSIYFSDSTVIPPAINADGFYDTMASFILAFFEGRRTGRQLKYDPSTKSTSFVAGDMYYSNGVALAPDGSYILVAETGTLRILRHWLQGPKSGEIEVFLERTPGYPDGVTNGSNETYWISLVTLNSRLIQSWMSSRFLRWLAPNLPASLKKTRLGSGILQLSAEGKVLRYLDDVDGSQVATISAVTETVDGLYLGNLGGDFVSFLSKTDLPAAS